MIIKTLKSFPKNENPFKHDLIRMGTEIKHVESYGFMVMYGMDKNSIVIVDITTGERVEIKRNKENEI